MLSLYRLTADSWASDPDPSKNAIFFDEEKLLGGGVYIWRDRASALRWHGDDYVEMVILRYGSPPRIQILDAVICVDARAGRFEEL